MVSRDSLNMLVTKRKSNDDEQIAEDDSQKLIVFFPDHDKLNMQSLKTIALKMLDTNVFNSIVVIKGSTQISRRVLFTKDNYAIGN